MGEPILGPEVVVAEPGPDAVRQQLERILASAQFAHAPAMRKMLRFVVDHALEGTADRLKEYTLGVEVFGRGADFDPRQDTIVRVQARRLRERLDDYYRTSGNADSVRIGLPTGHYVPAFGWVAREASGDIAGSPDPAEARSPAPRRRAAWLRLLTGLALVGLAAAVVLWSRDVRQPQVPASSDAPLRIAVLPFADMSQARDQEWLADGLTEEILNQLSQVSGLRVIGRTSSFSFKGKHEDLRSIGRKLGVTHLIEGSVRRDGTQLRITTQLNLAEDGSHLWSRSYARDVRDVFAVQEDIARDVAQALSVKLDVVAFNREQGGTTNVDAYERFLRWRGSMMRELFDFEHDRERLQLAREMVAIDPRCILCRDALAKSLDEMAHELRGAQAEQLRTEAGHVRQQLAVMAPDSWLAKRERASALWRQGRRAEAIALARQILESGPLTWERAEDYVYMIFAMGRLDENVAIVEQVRAIEPMALYLSRDLQFDYIAARRYEDAESEYKRGAGLEGSQIGPDYAAFFRQLAGKRPGGVETLRALHNRLRERGDRFVTPSFGTLGSILDDREAMLALARKAISEETGSAEEVGFWASLADALGDADLAVIALRKQLHSTDGFLEGRMPHAPYYAFWVLPYSDVRSHPEFKSLLRQAGVVDYWRQSGRWGDGCAPTTGDDFRCK